MYDNDRFASRTVRPRRFGNNPKFIINNLGDVHTIMNSKMASDLATLILSTELNPNEGHLFAFAKQLEKAKINIESHLNRVQEEIDSTQSETSNDIEYIDDNEIIQ
jgi:hypothetical protein